MQSKLSLYGQYITECSDRNIIETPKGFIVYDIKDDVCCVIDIFIVKEARSTGFCYKLCNQVREIALGLGCKKMVSWIDLRSKTAMQALKANLSLGMKVVEAQNNVLRLERDI